MSGLVSLLLSYVLIYKYLAIFIITYLGALAFPLPSGTVVAASAAFAIQGYLNFPLVLFIGILGNVTGDMIQMTGKIWQAVSHLDINLVSLRLHTI